MKRNIPFTIWFNSEEFELLKQIIGEEVTSKKIREYLLKNTGGKNEKDKKNRRIERI